VAAKIMRFVWLAALAPATLAASPPTRVGLTVDEFDRLLLSMHDTSDSKAARELAGMKLTERVSADRLARWEKEIPGSRSREALVALADASASLRPPVDEIPSSAPPDDTTQKQILARVKDYIKETIPKLPNFFALRTTTSFEITTENLLQTQQDMTQLFQKQQSRKIPHQALGPAKWSGVPDGQLFWIGSLAQTVSYRGGFEDAEPATPQPGQTGKFVFNLTTTGEFGPVLATILDEAPVDRIVWDHWEQGSAGSLAVFRYAVPRERSHFAVDFSADHVPDFPAYHGEIAVDPAKGTVFRITIEASERDPAFVHEVFTLVEFGPMQIAGMDYFVPVRGVAIAKTYDPYADLSAEPEPIPYQISINDTSFTNYHVFRTKSHVVSGASGP
jgi:hypothetical protein